MPSCDLEGLIVLAYVHSQMNPQTCTRFGANRSSCLVDFLDFWMFPQKNPNAPPPGVLKDNIFPYRYVHDSQMNPQTYAKVGPNRCSRLATFPGFEFLTP